MNLTVEVAEEMIEDRDAEALEIPDEKENKSPLGGRRTRGVSGKETLDSLKENPYAKFELDAVADTWFGSVTLATLKFALFILNGYVWEARNSDRFLAHHSELHRVEQIQHRMTWLIDQNSDNGTFWPELGEWEQLALIEFVMILPSMWD